MLFKVFVNELLKCHRYFLTPVERLGSSRQLDYFQQQTFQ
jgi:hypothetical protein